MPRYELRGFRRDGQYHIYLQKNGSNIRLNHADKSAEEDGSNRQEARQNLLEKLEEAKKKIVNQYDEMINFVKESK